MENHWAELSPVQYSPRRQSRWVKEWSRKWLHWGRNDSSRLYNKPTDSRIHVDCTDVYNERWTNITMKISCSEQTTATMPKNDEK